MFIDLQKAGDSAISSIIFLGGGSYSWKICRNVVGNLRCETTEIDDADVDVKCLDPCTVVVEARARDSSSHFP